MQLLLLPKPLNSKNPRIKRTEKLFANEFLISVEQHVGRKVSDSGNFDKIDFVFGEFCLKETLFKFQLLLRCYIRSFYARVSNLSKCFCSNWSIGYFFQKRIGTNTSAQLKIVSSFHYLNFWHLAFNCYRSCTFLRSVGKFLLIKRTYLMPKRKALCLWFFVSSHVGTQITLF